MRNTHTTNPAASIAIAIAVVRARMGQYRATIMRNLEKAVKAGKFSQKAVADRAERAVEVLRTYSITDTGRKINGWGELVHAFTLENPRGREYEVQVRDNGQTSCNCPDWIYRRGSHGGFCKHSLAISALVW
jgi:hypothetical protein